MSLNMTNIVGLFTLSTTLSYRSVGSAGFFGGGVISPLLPAQYCPVRARAKYMYLLPFVSGLE